MHQADAAPADANIGVSPHIQNPTIFLYNLLPKVELFKYSLLSVKSLKIKEFQSNFATKPPTASKVICYTENKITIFDENHQKKFTPRLPAWRIGTQVHIQSISVCNNLPVKVLKPSWWRSVISTTSLIYQLLPLSLCSSTIQTLTLLYVCCFHCIASATRHVFNKIAICKNTCFKHHQNNISQKLTGSSLGIIWFWQ